MTSKLDGLEDTWQTVYDAAGNPVATIDPCRIAQRPSTMPTTGPS